MRVDAGRVSNEHVLVMKTESRILCIPTIEDKGSESRVSEHFGRAPHHVLVELRTGETRSLRKDGGCDGDHGHCMPVDVMLENGVDVVVCKGIGKGAINRLMLNRIGVLATAATDVAGVVEEFRERSETMGQPRVCSGHHH